MNESPKERKPFMEVRSEDAAVHAISLIPLQRGEHIRTERTKDEKGKIIEIWVDRD